MIPTAKAIRTETLTFDNTPVGRKAARKAVEIFGKRGHGTIWRNDYHDSIAVTIREEISFSEDYQ